MDRRSFMASWMAGGAVAASGLTTGSAKAQTKPLTMGPDDPVGYYWDKKFSELVDLEPLTLSEPEKERHRIFAYLVLSLLHGYFNGQREGMRGEYPWGPSQKISGQGTDSFYKGPQYLGHNIAAIAVDGNGDIIDFDFNHNAIFNSSIEHAEVRLMRRVFSLAEIEDGWELRDLTTQTPEVANLDDDYGMKLSGVTVYTSLESCAQCSGMMTLGNVKQVVFAQTDPSQYQIGRIMYRLSRPVGKTGGRGAPRPISGTEIGLDLTDRLDQSFVSYQENVGREAPKKPFFKPPGSDQDPSRWSASRSITAFLCTDTAYDHFAAARKIFDTMQLAYPDYKPASNSNRVHTNLKALEQARRFFNYAMLNGRRGTPHK